jgi:hypothetical protein
MLVSRPFIHSKSKEEQISPVYSRTPFHEELNCKKPNHLGIAERQAFHVLLTDVIPEQRKRT